MCMEVLEKRHNFDPSITQEVRLWIDERECEWAAGAILTLLGEGLVTACTNHHQAVMKSETRTYLEVR